MPEKTMRAQQYDARDNKLHLNEVPIPTPREHEVLALMAEGRSNSAIADSLSVSDGAVEKHVSNILSKLGLPPADTTHRRVLAVLTYLRS